MNNVILIGRITRDLEVQNSKSGMAICKFTLAVNRMKKDDPADFINCVAFGKTAEVVAEYVKKGHRLAVNGRIQTGSYKNKDDIMVYTTDIMVNNVEFLETKNNNDSAPVKTQKKVESTSDSDNFPF